MNYKIFTSLLLSVFFLGSFGQTPSGYEPFHQFLLQNHQDIQKHHGNERQVVFRELGYSHNIYQPSAGTWTPSDSGVFTYVQNVNTITETNGSFYKFSNATLTWPNSAQILNSVNGLGLIQSSVYQVADTTAWVNQYQYLYSYNPLNNYVSTKELQVWNGSVWVDSIQYNYTYSANNYDSIVVLQTWNGSWQNDSQYLYTYNGFMNTQTITQAWNGTSWVNVFNKYTSAFDPNGNPAQSQIYKWNGTSWGLYQQLITGYDGFGDLTNFTQQIWSPSANGGLGAYINYYSEIYEYVLGDNTQFNNYQWDTTITPQTKTNLLQYTYSYDVNHNVLYELDQTFASDTLGSTDQYFYTYRSFNVSGLSELANDLHVSVFPNPSTGNSAVLSFVSDKVNPVSVTTYDALGKILSEIQLTTSSGMNQIPLNLAGTASGNYFVKIADNSGKISVVKFVKQ